MNSGELAEVGSAAVAVGAMALLWWWLWLKVILFNFFITLVLLSADVERFSGLIYVF